MPFRYITTAKRNGATSGYKWRQDEWLRQRTARRGFGDQFGMDEGSCYMFSAEWLIMCKRNMADLFTTHMSVPAVHDTMQTLKIAQRSGQAQQVQTYMQMNGLIPVGSKDYNLPLALDLAQDVTKYSGYYIMGFSNMRPIDPAVGANHSAHAIAIHIGQTSMIFDPNYGMARFVNADDLCGFLVELLMSGYRDLRGLTTIWKYR